MTQQDDVSALWEARHTLGDQLQARALALPDSPERTVILARAAATEARSDKALSLASEAEAQLPERDVWRARALETIAITLNEMGLDREATPFYTQAGEIYEACGDTIGRIGVMQNAGTLSWHSYDTSRGIFLEALALAEPIGHPILTGVILLNLGEVAIRSHAPRTERERWILRGIEILDESASDLQLKGRGLLADSYLDDGDVHGARQLLAGAPPAHEVASLTTRTTLAVVQARLLRVEGRAPEAVELLEACLVGPLHPSHETRLREQLSLSLEAAGDLSAALVAARRATAIYRTMWDSTADRHERALEVWHRTQQLRQQRAAAVERAEALAQALAERETALAQRERALDELQQAHARIRELSIRDPLTGLHNRLYLMEQAPTILAEADPERPGAVALLDLDHFKRLNDLHGHAAGDAVLQEFGHLLAEHTGPDDLVARYGGEEFVVVRPRGEDGEGPRSLAADLHRLASAVARHEWAGVGTAEELPDAAEPVRVGVSIGVTPATDSDLSANLESADRLMYTAKRAGGNRVVAAALSDATT